MPFLHDFSSNKSLPDRGLTLGEIYSIYYHDIFEYPLTFSELIKWTAGNAPKVQIKTSHKNGLYFVTGKEGLVYKKSVHKRCSKRKMEIAGKASKLISILPSIKMVGVTGSLAMNNADKGSDIDLLIVTSKGKLWGSRIAVYIILKIFGFSLRVPGSSKQKDRLCLNMWMDESDLEWSKKERNVYTAHEILQIKPLINKKGTYEKLLLKNKWALSYWPNAVDIKNTKDSTLYTKQMNLGLLENIAYKIQLAYMKPKMTKELVTPTRAIFHPNDFSKFVLKRCS